MNFMTRETETDPLKLDNIRRTLVRLEDTIIFLLIERAQFAHNPKMYTKEGFSQVLHRDGFTGSWLEWLLRETEVSHAKIRRFDSPDEHPFTPRSELPTPILPPLSYPPLLHDPTEINVNARILSFYTESIVPRITSRAGTDDGNYGSAGTRDLECLQAISRRIHCGMFVSESKFLEHPAAFVPHIQNPNPQALLDLITKPAVEAALLVRLAKKARWYGAELGPDGEPLSSVDRVDVEQVVRLYREYIIPLTKDVEVEYLLHRLDGLTPEQIAKFANTERA
ncbi:chorismate mutase ARO7 [Sporobolomyces koalae]|uniref:chorismate mutase ARO7 n=1 Tax=Sporobolomyces koalae TaxID=500713 RepID=UPI00316BA4AA